MRKRIAPIYFGPWQFLDWNRYLRSDCVSGIINPLNGPGSPELIDAYYGVVTAAQRRGKKTYGYVATGRPEKKTKDQLIAEMQMYKACEFVDDIFFDQVEFDKLPKGIHAFARANFANRTPIYNVGTRVDPVYFDKHPGSLIVTFEGPASEYESQFGWGLPIGRYAERQIHLIYSATSSPFAFTSDIGYAYLTPDGFPNPWDSFVQ